MASDPQREYAEARAAYLDAMARLREAKRHIPPFPRDLRKQRVREEREARRTRLANAPPASGPTLLTLNMVTAKALQILHQRVNAAQLHTVQPITSNDDE